MIGFLLRLGRLFGALAAVLLIALTAVSTASAGATPPDCPTGAAPGAVPAATNLAAACVQTGFVSDSYTAQIGGHKLSLTGKVFGHGEFAYEVFTLTATFAVDRQECPQGAGVPYADIPCQMDSANMAIMGRYVAGHKTLVADTSLNELNPYDQPDCTANANQGVCTDKFRLNENTDPGFSELVVLVRDGQLTQNAGNDLGQSGFEFAIGVNVPHVAKPKARPKGKQTVG